jgi:hypothetical protein
MKRPKIDQVEAIIKELLDEGEIVIGRIRVNDGENVVNYIALSACPPEHREGYRLALETCGDVYLRDVGYKPVCIAWKYATSIATLE